MSFFLILTIFFPFFAAVTTGIISSKIGKYRAIQISAILNVSQTILIGFLLILHLNKNAISYSVTLGNWISVDLMHVEWNFLFDRFNVVMIFVVSFVSLCVQIYSLDYMKEDPHLLRFVTYISLFTLFMLILVLSNNLLVLFLGWEGVGVCSYLLVNFWFTRVNANKAAMKALFVNRIGDFGLTLGLIVIFFLTKSLDFAVVFSTGPFFFFNEITTPYANFYFGTLVGILLFTGAVGKSAQIGLHTWLPDAMEGPTPVSALIHAATMVTAGVLLIIKCSPLFEYMPSVLSLLVFIGAFTSLFSASVALVQNDIKKVIAYSTCSQLGYMVFACGLSSYHASFFHLVNHAFFKSLLFLTAGAIIHSMNNEQDTRKFGAVNYLLPLSSVTITVGSLALAGTPFLSGFYSKDLIIELSFSHFSIPGTYAYVLGVLTAVLTSVYSYRIFFLTFVVNAQFFRTNLKKIHESTLLMNIPLIVLSFASIMWGFFSKDWCVGLGSNFWSNAIFIHPLNNTHLEAEFIPQTYKILPFCCSLILIFLVNSLYTNNVMFLEKKNLITVHRFFTSKWYFDINYNLYVANILIKNTYNIIFKALDKGLFECLGPSTASLFFSKFSFFLKQKQNGQLHDYSFFFIVSTFFFLHTIYLFIPFNII